VGKKAPIGLIVLSILFFNSNIIPQEKEWKTKITKDGEITVNYRISKRIDENSNSVPMIEYVATTFAFVKMQNCISVIKDGSKHKEFTDDEVSKTVKTISDNEWIVYYYTNSPWPISDSDLVTKMKFSEDETIGLASFTLTAAPSMFEKADVKRMTYYKATYNFKDLGDGKVEITITGKMSPSIKAPAWMISAWFPNGPTDMIQGIVKLAENE